MAPLTPGTRFDVLTQKIWWAPPGTVLPALDLAYGGTYPTGWNLIDDTENGVAVTSTVNRTAYNSDERGTIGQLLGDFGVAIGFTDQTPTWELAMQLASFSKTAQAAQAGPPAYPAADFWHQNASATGFEFMIGFDAKGRPGGAFADNTLIRGIAYAAVQSAAAVQNFRTRGTDSPFRIVAALECQPYPVKTTSSMLTGTGINAASIDPDEKFDYMVLASTA